MDIGTARLAAQGIATGGQLIGGLFNSGSQSARAAALQYQYNLSLQREAQKFNEYMYRNRYQMQVEDLEKAGINKLYGLGSAPTTSSVGGSVGMPDMVTEKNNRMQNFLTGIDLASNLTARQVQNEKIQQETKTEKVNTEIKKLEEINQELENIYSKKKINWFDKRQAAELEEIKSKITKNIEEAGEARERAQNARENNNLIRANTKETENKAEINGREAQWIKDHPVLSGFGIGMKYLGPSAKYAKDAIEAGLEIKNPKMKKAAKQASRSNTARGKVKKENY